MNPSGRAIYMDTRQKKTKGKKNAGFFNQKNERKSFYRNGAEPFVVHLANQEGTNGRS